MLGKLMKYECKACGRIFVPMWAIAVGMSLLLLVVGSIVNAFAPAPAVGEMVSSITTGISTLMLVGLIILSVVVIIVRFYQNLIADEGYLSFTLPVTAARHIWSKLLTGLIFLAGSAVVIALSLMITGFGGFIDFWSTLFAQLGRIQDGWLFFFLMIGVFLLAAVLSIFKLYSCMVIGSQFGRYRIIGSVLAYYVQGIAESILMLAVFLPVFLPWLDNLSQVDVQLAEGVLRPFVFLMLGVMAAIFVVFSVAYFLISRWLLSKRLNLQ